MEIEVYNISGAKTSRKLKLDDSLFAVEPNDHAIYLDVKQHLANKRQGTHKSKDRSEISGSTKKLKRQKGTGGARSGDINSPLFKGGGRVFGPRPRDYNFKLNKKLKRLARLSALSYKAADNCIVVLEDFKMDEPKTKSYLQILKNLNLADKRTLLVTPAADNNLTLSSRNLSKSKVLSPANISTYEILNAANLLLTESAVKELEKVYAEKNETK